MEPVAIVTVLALVQYGWFGYLVAQARVRYGVQAPATTGHPEFDRRFRIQQNTLEQLVVFIPALWLFGWYAHALTAAGFGVLFMVGRYVYSKSYARDPSTRMTGVAIGGAATIVLLIGGALGALISWF